ncbi:TerC/Alx family metal homeostasis membrane protein [Roseospira marina]|uniref:TerC/Alx family metal homeostasis membrane protein n=1 Tax=Roseospira marina TaxID=140057 RepID=A0A5M6IE47_9PROT|nr:TerC/Alx family metal homeostasis membrane protein [Roseospira marina]KAA5605858.1 TerC/Alx family metal homeostasis membrane protein [Roseospira marina]MBB4313677.1 tellurite resistance protein TerC [Roseospira marina]MBB5086839.1 tellurite resistance protein TerC [Roseospira marina]
MGHFGFPVETVAIFFGAISLSVFMDLFAHRKNKEISVLDASLWSVFWVGLAVAFYGYLWVRFDKQWADLYLAGVALEKSLSIDNLMVFMAIFASFGIRGALQHRILYWGIIGALVFRALFVAAGTGLFQLTPWVGFIFAAIVAWSGWKMLRASGDDEDIVDYSEHWSVKMTEKVMPIFPRLHAERFFVTRAIVKDLADADPTIRTAKDAAVFATPAFLCLMAIETSDIMFAFDSVPAVIAVTQEPLLVYAAMIFAVLGLRSLYFVLAALTRYLVHLEKAVIALLFFIAFKLTVQSGEHVFGWDFLHIDPNVSLLVVLGTLAVGVVASFIWPEKEEPEGDEETQPSDPARKNVS